MSEASLLGASDASDRCVQAPAASAMWWVRSPNPWEVLFRLFGLYAVTAALSCLVASHLIWNRTPSMPLGFYWLTRGRDVRSGDVVALAVPANVWQLVRERDYLPRGALLIKPVVAVAGDRVCARDGWLEIEGRAFGRVLVNDSAGRSLPQFSECGLLGVGQVFLAAHHLKSFDSRTFGPVNVRDIQGTVTPLWTY